MKSTRTYPRQIRTPEPAAFDGNGSTASSLRLVNPVVSSGQTPMRSERSGKPMTQSAAIPFTFSGTVGHFMPPALGVPSTGTAVLMVSPWGFEEMSSRRFGRVVAEKLADQGVPSLRFDYPGTGDALDDVDFSTGLAVWENSIVEAGQHLLSLSKCSRLIVIGQSLGAALALNVVGRLQNVDAVVLLAPVLSGRQYLRELAIWSRTIDNNLLLREDQRDTYPVSIASLRMPQPIADQVKKLNMTTIAERPAPKCLMLVPRERPQDLEFAERLKSLGTETELSEFVGYDQMVSNVTYSKVSMEAVEKISAWIATARSRNVAGEGVAIPVPVMALPLQGDGFRETPVRFGREARLAGMLCEPAGDVRGAPVVLMSTAYERHASWGRMNLIMARELARQGIPSFRFDTANVADSPPLPGIRDEVLYSDSQQLDVKEALDFLESRGLHSFVSVGRCSGAYLAFQSAVQDKRIESLVAVNPYVFFWPQEKSVEEFMKFVPRQLTSYAPLLFKVETLKRILNGDINVKAAVFNIARGLIKKLMKLAGPLVTLFPGVGRERRSVRQSFDTLLGRDIPFDLVFSEGDLGLRHFSEHFGTDASGLSRYPNVALTMLKDADHNLTPAEARAAYFEMVKNAALDLANRKHA